MLWVACPMKVNAFCLVLALTEMDIFLKRSSEGHPIITLPSNCIGPSLLNQVFKGALRVLSTQLSKCPSAMSAQVS